MRLRAPPPSSARSFQAQKCSTFPAAITCGGSETRSTNQACWNFSPRNEGRGGCRDRRASALEFRQFPTTLESSPAAAGRLRESAKYEENTSDQHLKKVLTVRWRPGR